MSEVGVTQTGFAIKPFQDILNDKAARASEVFGADVDLRSTSALRKLLDVTSAEDQELWKQMEGFYYSNFISTASGDALDRLGEDVDVNRRFLNATGKIKLKLSGEAPGRLYSFPIGTLVETGAPIQQFRTAKLVALSSQNKEVEVDVAAALRGPGGNAVAGAINKINATFAGRLNLGGAQVAELEADHGRDRPSRLRQRFRSRLPDRRNFDRGKSVRAAGRRGR